MTFKVGDKVRLQAIEDNWEGGPKKGLIYTVDGYDPQASACIFLKEMGKGPLKRRQAWFDWRFELVEREVAAPAVDYTSDELWDVKMERENV